MSKWATRLPLSFVTQSISPVAEEVIIAQVGRPYEARQMVLVTIGRRLRKSWGLEIGDPSSPIFRDSINKSCG